MKKEHFTFNTNIKYIHSLIESHNGCYSSIMILKNNNIKASEIAFCSLKFYSITISINDKFVYIISLE